VVWVDATPRAGTLPAWPAGWPAVRFYLTAQNLDAVAAGIERAVGAGALAVSLPNLPLFGDVLRCAESIGPDPGALAALATRIAAALRDRPGVALHVHHYALWQALRAAGAHPQGEGSPGAGCQAGAALAYVDPAGILYPCASLPVPLAKIDAGAIARAWSGPVVAALREGIGTRPGLCAGCPCEPTCRGGCRGWAHVLAASWDAVGPDCVRAAGLPDAPQGTMITPGGPGGGGGIGGPPGGPPG
jgi:radical SAM protein with 4Fe4S-binding SPASM domain